MMLAAIETMTDSDPVRCPRRHNADLAAPATTRISLHALSPLQPDGQCYDAKHGRRNQTLDFIGRHAFTCHVDKLANYDEPLLDISTAPTLNQIMHVSSPPEALPEVGTVANPAVLYDGNDAFVCYEASERSGGGNVVLKFAEIIEFRVTPTDVEGLEECRYPVSPWAFNEVIGGGETTRWQALNPRLWLISFNDVMVEVLFETVSVISRDKANGPPHKALIAALR